MILDVINLINQPIIKPVC